MVETWHGTENGYNRYKCRCNECRSAHSLYGKKRRLDNSEKIQQNLLFKIKVGPTKHGTVRGYLEYRCRCTECKAEYSIYCKQRRLKQKAKHPEKKPLTERERAYGKEYNIINAVARAAYNKRYNELHADERKEYRLAHKDEHAAYSSRRRAQRLNQFVENVERAILYDRDKGMCYLCNIPVDPNDWHMDHKFPLSKGGEHSYANMAVSHPHCNLSKNAKIL